MGRLGSKHYTYPGRKRLIIIIFAFVLLIMGPILLGFAFTTELLLIIAGVKTLRPEELPELAAIIIGIPIGLAVVMPTINAYPEIKMTEDGLLVQIFVFRFVWKFIPWEDITELIKPPYFNRLGLSVWVIQVKRLTFWHHLLGLIYTSKWKPVILVTSDIQEYNELIKIIQDHCESTAQQ